MLKTTSRIQIRWLVVDCFNSQHKEKHHPRGNNPSSQGPNCSLEQYRTVGDLDVGALPLTLRVPGPPILGRDPTHPPYLVLLFYSFPSLLECASFKSSNAVAETSLVLWQHGTHPLMHEMQIDVVSEAVSDIWRPRVCGGRCGRAAVAMMFCRGQGRRGARRSHRRQAWAAWCGWTNPRSST